MPPVADAQLQYLAEQAVTDLLGIAFAHDPEAVLATVVDVADRPRGIVHCQHEHLTVPALCRAVERLRPGDGVFLRKAVGSAWGEWLYDSFGFRGDVAGTDPRYYLPRVESTLQMIIPAGITGHVGFLGVDYPSRIVGYCLMAEAGNTSAAQFDLLSGASPTPGVRPTLTSLCAGAFPGFSSTDYVETVAPPGWRVQLDARSRIEVRVLAPAPQTTLLLTLEREVRP